MQEFNLDKKFKIVMKVCFVVFAAFLVLGVALPFLPDDGKGSAEKTFILSTMCIVVFGFCTILAWLTLRKLPYVDIIIDDDGLWYKHKQKKHDLVPWKKIDKLKERAYRQCLDVLDSSGRKLIRVEYQLNNFDTLRSILNEKAIDSNQNPQRTHFSKSALYHLFYAGILTGFSWMGLYVGRNVNPMFGYVGTGILFVIILHEYLVTAFCLDMTGNGLTIIYPIKKRFILYSDISSVEMVDTFHKGSRHPEVWLKTKNTKKPYKFNQLGVDANILYVALKKAMKSRT